MNVKDSSLFDQDEDVEPTRIDNWSDTLGIQRQEFFKYSTKPVFKTNNEDDSSTNVVKRKRKRVVILDDDDEEDSDYELTVTKSKQQKKTNSAKRKPGSPSFNINTKCNLG